MTGTSRDMSGALAMDLSCETPVAVDFAPEVSVVQLRSGRATCSRMFEHTPAQPTEPFACECWNSDGAQPYSVLAEDDALASRELIKHCLVAEEPALAGPEVCLREAGASPNSCRSSERCFRTWPLSNGASLAEEELHLSLWCDTAEEDAASDLQCGCSEFASSTDTDLTHYFWPSNAETSGLCDLAICDPASERAWTGTPACELGEIVSENSVSCSGFHRCSQAATVTGRDLLVEEYLSVRCRRGSNEAWWCSCALADKTAVFELGEASDSDDACVRADAGCLERIALPLVPSLHGAVPPDPLPAR